MPLEKRYLGVVSLSRDKVFGSFVIGVPETKVLELKQKYPDCETRGRIPEWTSPLSETSQRAKNDKSANISYSFSHSDHIRIWGWRTPYRRRHRKAVI